MESYMKSNQGCRGSVLPLAVVLILVLLFVGLGLLQLGYNTRMRAIRTTAVFSARAAADAGFVEAVRIMKANFAGGIGSLPASSATFDESYSGASYNYVTTYDANSGSYHIDSTGTAGIATRTVHTILGKRSSWFGIGVKDTLDFKVNCVLGTVPEGGPLVVRTNDNEPGDIILRQGVTIPGDVIVGPGINSPNEVIVTKHNSDIEGKTYIDEPILFRDVDAPNNLPVVNWSSVVPDVNGNVSVLTSTQYDTILLSPSIEKLVVTGSGVQIYVTGDMKIFNGNALVVTGGSSLELYIGGQFIADYGSLITNENVVSSPPTDAEIEAAALSLALYGLPSCDSIVIKNSGDFYGGIYAPDADIIMMNDGDVYGAIVGNSLEIKNSGEFGYVSKLGDPNLTNVPTHLAVNRWWED
ncbi:MAG: collagen-binding domain-containing protein [Planctomycetota bacterium]